MAINVNCEFHNPVKIGERAVHGTFDSGDDIIEHRCSHEQSSTRRNLVSKDGLCDTSHDYCPYNPSRDHEEG